MSVKNLTIIGVMAAVMCILAPWSLQIGPVPVTGATLAVYLVGAIGGKMRGVAAVTIYILLGMVGLPVFSGFTGGLQRVLGVTGGYILGYIPCVYVTGAVISRLKKYFWGYPVAMVLGTVLLYVTGAAWYVGQTGNSVWSALMICVIPFLPGDVVKIVMASVFSHELNKRVIL